MGEILKTTGLATLSICATYASFKYIDKHASDDIPRDLAKIMVAQCFMALSVIIDNHT
jgi:hypothetical protein